MRSVSIWLCVQGQLAEFYLYCVGYNVLEQSVLGQYIVNVIHISRFVKVIHYCINCKERGRTINLHYICNRSLPQLLAMVGDHKLHSKEYCGDVFRGIHKKTKN